MHNLKYLSFIIIAICVLFLSCEKKDSSVIDPVLNFPTISNPSITPNTFDTTLIHGIAKVTVVSVDPVQRVTVQVTDPTGVDRGTYQLLDTANDGVYSGYINFTMDCRLVGQYKATFLAQTTAGLSSNTIILNFSVINSHDRKPVLSNLVAPDSIQAPPFGDTIYFCLHLTASDPDGPCDLNNVWFNSFRPDGTPNEHNPFFMYDDGNAAHCDSVAHDGIYSLGISLIHNSLLQFGTFTFKYNAMDNSNVLSDTLTHYIYVHQ